MTTRKAPRDRGTGSVRRLPSGRWQARIYQDGQHVPLGSFVHKADANAALRAAITSGASMVDRRRGSEVTFGAYAAEWLEHRRISMRTKEGYESVLRTRLAPLCGRKLSALDGPAVRRWWAEARGHGQAPKAYRLLKAILNTAVEDGLIALNPCRIQGAGGDDTPERPMLSAAQVVALADAIDPRYRTMVLLAGFGSLRLGELRGLRRARVDLDAGTVTVADDGNVQDDRHGHVYFVAPKSRAGRRTVTLPTPVVADLRKHMDGIDDDPRALVFPGAAPQVPLTKRTIYRAWHAAAAKVDGLPAGLHIHDLRHAGATMAAQTGATTKEIMARIGHSSPQAALIYQHAAEERDHEIARRMAAMMG